MTDQLKTPFNRVTGPELLRQGMDVDGFCGLLVVQLACDFHSDLDPNGMDDHTYMNLRDEEVETAMSEAKQAASELCRAAMRLEASGVEDLNAMDVLHAFGGERYRRSVEDWFDVVPRWQLEKERDRRASLQKRLKAARAELAEIRACC